MKIEPHDDDVVHMEAQLVLDSFDENGTRLML